jgi:hypothetical protein
VTGRTRTRTTWNAADNWKYFRSVIELLRQSHSTLVAAAPFCACCCRCFRLLGGNDRNDDIGGLEMSRHVRVARKVSRVL